MNQIFDALNPQNQNDVFDCCNGNLKCKEKEFSKKCVSTSSSSTFSFVAPELTCDITPANREYIYAVGIALTSFVNTTTGILINSILLNDYSAYELTIPTNTFISIFDTSTSERTFTNAPSQFLITYAEAINAFTANTFSRNSVAFVNFINGSALSDPALKTMAKNLSINKKSSQIQPHASYNTATVYTTSITAQTDVVGPCSTTRKTSSYVLYMVQAV